eukprot:376631-Amphidinium_carterae.1
MFRMAGNLLLTWSEPASQNAFSKPHLNADPLPPRVPSQPMHCRHGINSNGRVEPLCECSPSSFASRSCRVWRP